MPQPPAQPKIYHIVHVDRLASIVADGCLWSDAEVIKRGQPGSTIGMGGIKARRLTLPVECHPGGYVGEFVPFYFCPRSIMLYVIYRANHPELAYRGGQGPIVHLEADLHEVVAWADASGRRWAFSLSNAGANYTEFRSRVDQLNEVDWPAVAATDFRADKVKEGKQAEFLVHQQFPWHLVRRIGVSAAPGVAQQAASAMGGVAHRPVVEIRRDWYF
jgi:ssDNA thymidine ADP-ribosyltransferase DarT-like protein